MNKKTKEILKLIREESELKFRLSGLVNGTIIYLDRDELLTEGLRIEARLKEIKSILDKELL